MSNLALYSALAVFAAIVYSAAIGTSQATWSGNYSSPLINQGFLYGWICALISTPLIKAGAKCILSYYFTGIGQDKLYGLDHVLLDVKIPPPSMWINMGYWKNTQSFPEACTALLEKVLQTAGLLNSDGRPLGVRDHSIMRIIDVGLGCGDQTLYLTNKLSRIDHVSGSNPRPLFDDYIGITINRHQAEFARRRIKNTTSREKNIHIFCADAAKPTSWSRELKKVVTAASEQEDDHMQPRMEHTWLLALDTLYHFKPSREPLLYHAARNLHASLMAFDLILADSVSPVNRILLNLMCLVSSTPFSNFKTQSEYENMLFRAGYSYENIEMHDISEYVFSGIAGYIEQKESELRQFGLSLGKLRVAGKLFGWWGRSGIVRGVIIVAKREERNS